MSATTPSKPIYTFMREPITETIDSETAKNMSDKNLIETAYAGIRNILEPADMYSASTEYILEKLCKISNIMVSNVTVRMYNVSDTTFALHIETAEQAF